MTTPLTGLPFLTVPLPGRRPGILLELDLSAAPVWPDSDDPLAKLRTRGRASYPAVLRTLHLAGRDSRVAGFIAKVGGRLPWAVAQELRRGVETFRRAGKPTLAWAESFGEGGDSPAYLLATVFDELWLQPGGGLGLLGAGVEATLLRSLLDRFGIEPELEQRHEYKNAADQLLRSDLSAAHRESLERLTASLTGQLVDAVAARRTLSPARVRDLLESGPYTASEARAAGLVDRLGYRDEAYDAVRARIGGDTTLLFADRWRPRTPLRDRLPDRRRRRRTHVVGLVEVRGAIVSGHSHRSPFGRQAGSDTVTAALRAAGRDDSVRAVLLRVDSPGGSAVASEAIWREVCRVREAGKPVVVSMGAVAASGGYYVACPADVIVALPATLTGSIGVFGGKVVVQDLLERWGIHTGEVAAGPHALMYSARRRFDEHERRKLAAALDAIYDDFVGKVAAGRRRPAAEIEPLARGRVWTGADARDHGLVDALGGFRDALRIARERAGLADDAAVRPVASVGVLARLGRPRNSEDPRAAQLAIGLPSDGELLDRLVERVEAQAGPALRLLPFRLSG